MKRLLAALKNLFKQQFSLRDDAEKEFEIIDAIKKQVSFKGINLYTLIFAVLICSVGLNVNSTAVVIGAMLISPLMGPIMGLGLGVGINDFDLMKKAANNLILAVVFSVLVSCLYFMISPLHDVQSELLARTRPTTFDVLIAVFGGFTGVLAGSSKEKGNAIPGVAIATALMPPLCTAGFGIATGNWQYTVGAMYLFVINSIMISATTFAVVKILNFRPKEFIDKQRETFVKRFIYILIFLTILPSFYMGYMLYSETQFESNANQFIKHEMSFETTQIISKKLTYESLEKHSIEVFLMGEHIADEDIARLEKKMSEYGLTTTPLIIRQGEEQLPQQEIDVNSLKSDVLQELYEKNEATIASKDEQIELLENEVASLQKVRFPVKDMSNELQILYPNLETFSVSEAYQYNAADSIMDTLNLAYLQFSKSPKKDDLDKIESWMKQRLRSDKVQLVVRD